MDCCSLTLPQEGISMGYVTPKDGQNCLRLFLAIFFSLAITVVGFAAETETRNFKVKIDNKPSGEMTMVIHKADDGTITTSIDSDIHVTAYLLFSYKYSYHGKETWKDGILQKFESFTNDNGTRMSVAASREGPGMRVRYQNQEKIARGDCWPTTFWCLPLANKRNGVIPLLDAENGKDVDGNLQFQGQAQTVIAGQNITVNRYKVLSKSNTDVWFDGSDRTVKQSWMEDGHKVEMELSQLRRN